MEEDIFIVESFLKNKEMLLKHPTWVSEKTIQAIENLINKYKEVEKERDEIYADYQNLGKEKLELETMVELMLPYVDFCKDKNKCDTYKDCIECRLDYFKKKAKGE